MVWIIWGRRAYGRVAERGGEHAHTAFFHLWYMPLFPTQSVWMCEPGRGFATRWNRKSILATYLRMWGPLAALGCLLSGVLPAMLVGAGLGVASVGAWIARGVRDHRRSDFNLLAFSTRCEPALMQAEMRETVKGSLDARWAKLELDRSPDEVARFGPRSLDEAVVAYGLLRLAAEDRRASSALADRILTGTYEASPKFDGPYREGHVEVIPSAVIAQVEAAAAAQLSPQARAASVAARWTFTARKLGIGLLFGLIALAGIVKVGPSLETPTRVTPSDLAAGTVRDEYVEVDCDRIEFYGTLNEKSGAFACEVGDRVAGGRWRRRSPQEPDHRLARQAARRGLDVRLEPVHRGRRRGVRCLPDRAVDADGASDRDRVHHVRATVWFADRLLARSAVQ